MSKVISTKELAFKCSDEAPSRRLGVYHPYLPFSDDGFAPLFTTRSNEHSSKTLLITPAGVCAFRLNELILEGAPVGAYVEFFGCSLHLGIESAGFRKTSDGWTYEESKPLPRAF